MSTSLTRLKQVTNKAKKGKEKLKRPRLSSSGTALMNSEKKIRTEIGPPDQNDVLADVTASKKYDFGKRIKEFSPLTPNKRKKKDKNKNSQTSASSSTTKQR